MSLQSNIAKKIFSLVQKNVSKSEKKLIKLTHVFSKITIPPFIKRKISISIERVDGFDYVVMKHKTHNTNNKVMYIHGGAFIFQISTLHFLQIAEIINKTYTTFYIPIYPLTTDTYSSQFNTLDFLLKLYEIICNESDKKTSISIMGDSAGGNFALICAQLIKKNKLRICDNIVLLSPFLSYVYDKKYEEILNKDPVLTPMLLNTVKK
jgi:acetyl esterase/lipase